jgi:hypothetical protein
VSENDPVRERPATPPPPVGTTIVAAGVIAFGIVAAIALYTIHHRDYLAEQADSWARTFIRSSPVVEEQLGRVKNVKQVSEDHVAGKAPGWYLDYDVTGRRGMGVVDMRMTPYQYDDWRIPFAELDESQHKPINLR